MNVQKIVDACRIDCIRGDIANQPDMDAIVNAANAALRTGSGVAGAIHRAAGPQLETECRDYAPIMPGEAVISRAYGLPNRYVIHCLGPVYGVDKPSDRLLAACYRNAFRLAEEKQIAALAFPAISTGVFGYPFDAATAIVLQALLAFLPKRKHVRHVRFVLYSDADLTVYERAIHDL